MNDRLERAKETLTSGGYTLVLYDGNELIYSEKRGIAPLIELYESGRDFSAFSAADKVVGRAAAFMYMLLGIDSLFARCISDLAIDVLGSAGIDLEYDERVGAISNRDNTGYCPMESAVIGINSPKEAYLAIKQKLRELSGSTK